MPLVALGGPRRPGSTGKAEPANIVGAMADSFVHLHVHTEYSMLDGASRVHELVDKVARDGMPGLAVTDHGNMYGAIDFWQTCKDAGLNPIIGTEAYIATSGNRRDKARSSGDTYHLTLLATDRTGYKNLLEVSSSAFIDGFSYKPRMDLDLLSQHSAGLIATTGCLGGEVCQRLLEGDLDAALAAAGRHQEIFGRDNYFIEIQDHGLAEDAKVNPQLVEIAKRLGAPLVATNDSHYTDHDDAEAHDALLCVGTASLLSDKDRFSFQTDQFWVKTAAEMRHLFRELPEACDNTLLVCERADIDLEFGLDLLPEVDVPEGHTQASWLRQLVLEGARMRWGDDVAATHRERLDYELGVIEDMGFPSYFLIVADYIRWARDNGIRVGPGRGSAAGSAVSYCLRITEIDPIENGLFFERFLNPGRKSMPDIDVDFDDRYRGRVIDYVSDLYGEQNTAQVITFGKILAKQAVKDAARVLGYPFKTGDDLTKLMPPPEFGRPPSLRESLEKSKDFAAAYEQDPDANRIIELAFGLENLTRQEGVHACAYVISKEPLVEHVPLAITKNEARDVITQYEMGWIEKIGLLKMDFLGLRNLSVIEDCLEMLRARGVDLDIDDVPLDDADTYALLQRAESVGVFQLEGGAMRTLMKQLRPDRFEDIVALVALYRPGPMGMGMHTEYAERKNGRREITYDHPDLEPILAPTYGIMCYQEQVMEISRKIAGYSMAEADDFRKAMGKKKREVVAEQKVKFIEGCVAKGYARELGEHLFAQIEPFADYAFNKSHAACYGYVSYQTAYLKAHHPAEYMAALLTSVKDDKDKPTVYLAEARSMGITVLPPDINTSRTDFGVCGDPGGDRTITFGLSAVRNVGAGVVESIIRARTDGGPFVDFVDFCQRVDPVCLNKRTVESLVKGGAFDGLGHARKALLAVHEDIIDRVLDKRRAEDAGQFSLFDDPGAEGGSAGVSVDLPKIGDDEFDRMTKLRYEKEMLGLYVSDHPLRGMERPLRERVDATIAELAESKPDGARKWVGGVVVSAEQRFTKRGDRMLICTLEDFTGSAEVVVWASTLARLEFHIEEDVAYLMNCKVDVRDDELRLAVMEVKRPQLSEEAQPLRLRLPAARVTERLVAELRQILSSHPGQSPVFLHLRSQESETVVRLGGDFAVDTRPGLYAELKTLLGPDALVA